MHVTIPAYDDVPSTQLYVDVQGPEDGMPIMMLAGGPGGNGMSYASVVPVLGKDYRTVCFDPRGCARSLRDEGAQVQFCTIEHYVHDIEAVRQLLGLEQFVLLGSSYGAMAALQYATQYCFYGRLKGLISLNGAADHTVIEAARTIIDKKFVKGECSFEQKQWVDKFAVGDIADAEAFREYQAMVRPLCYVYPDKIPTHDAAGQPLPIYDHYVEVIQQAMQAGGFLQTFDIKDQLHKITCPVLAMVGDKDCVTPPTMTKVYSQYIRAGGNQQVQFEIVDDCGHVIFIDQPKLFYQVVGSFLTNLN